MGDRSYKPTYQVPLTPKLAGHCARQLSCLHSASPGQAQCTWFGALGILAGNREIHNPKGPSTQ